MAKDTYTYRIERYGSNTADIMEHVRVGAGGISRVQAARMRAGLPMNPPPVKWSKDPIKRIRQQREALRKLAGVQGSAEE